MSPRPAYLAALLPGPPSGERLRPPRGAFPGHDVPRPPAGQLAGAAEGLAREDAALRAYELGPEPPPSDQRARHDELAAGAEAWPATSFREQMHTLRNQALAPARPRPTDAFPAAAGSEHRDGVSRSPAAAGSPPSGHAGRRDALRPPRPPGTGESGAGTLPLAPPGSPSTAVEAGRGLDSLAGTHRRGGGAPGAQQATASPSGAATALAGPAQLRAARRDHA
ncbi:MAG TPA: hypothetical protein VMD59_09550, partial [Acidimicrobiales bacterium]|nr:hypothetical protein [Acidimicrobiales bacterium]